MNDITGLEKNQVIDLFTDEPSAATQNINRIVFIDMRTDSVVMIELDKNKKESAEKMPVRHSYSSTLSSIQSGRSKILDYKLPWFMLRTEDEIKQEDREVRDKNFKKISSLVSSDAVPAIFDPAFRGKMIAKLAKRLGIPRKSIYRLLIKYFKFGMQANALLPDYPECGAPGTERQPSEKKFGRPSKGFVLQHRKCEINSKLTKECRDNLRLGWKIFYVKEPKTDIGVAYAKTMKRFFGVEMEKRDGIWVPVQSDVRIVIPSKRQFSYWGHKESDALHTLRARAGEKGWAKNYQGREGTARIDLYSPLETYEIDSTALDMYLVSRYNDEWIIGRIVCYLVVDRFSTMIVGLYFGMEGPSWDGAKLALRNAFTDKVDFCKLYGHEISQHTWPAAFVPENITADRGEILGKKPDGMIKGLDIEITILPAYCPQAKGTVERDFRTTNEELHWLPGGVNKRKEEVGERDYRLDSAFNIEEVGFVIIGKILEHNRFGDCRHLLTQEMIKKNVAPHPVDIYHWGVENLHGSPKRYTKQEVMLHLLPTAKAKVTPQGIFFNGLYYLSEHARRELWTSEARRSGVREITIHYDPNSTNEIYYRPERSSSFETCQLTDLSHNHRDRRHEEAWDAIEYLRLMGEDEKNQIVMAKGERLSEIQAMVEAKKKKPRSKMSNKQRIGMIPENKQFEKEAERRKRFEVLRSDSGTSPSAPAVPASENTPSRNNTRDLLRKILESQ